MIAVNLDNFLHSLALAIEAIAGVKYSSAPQAIFRYEVVGETEPATALITYPGPTHLANDPEVVAVQVMTRAKLATAAMNQAKQIYDAMLGDNGQPKCGWSIEAKTSAGVAEGTYELKHIDLLQRPGTLGRDEKKMWMVSFNMEIRFVRRAAA